MRKLFLTISTTLLLYSAIAQNKRPIQDIMLSTYSYPYKISHLKFTSQHQDLTMAYMDIQPQKANGETVVLFHGKNFNGAYWQQTIESLTKEGYRVVVPDQIGFGKSSKPIGYQFTFQQLAINTKKVLDHLNLTKFSLVGHSMGGMLAIRYTLMYPENIEKLILENPIGLEDWKTMVPYASIDDNYDLELKATYESIYQYQLTSYYDNKWSDEYDQWVYPITDWIKSPDYPIVAKVNAQTTDMIFTQPVVYELNQITTPTLLIIGTRDRTALGKNRTKDHNIRDQMGRYQNLGKETQKKFKNAQLIEIENIGHSPHIESFTSFINPLLTFLKK